MLDRAEEVHKTGHEVLVRIEMPASLEGFLGTEEVMNWMIDYLNKQRAAGTLKHDSRVRAGDSVTLVIPIHLVW